MPRKTLRTLSPLERILLLREVPLFKTLNDNDLGQLADLAEEKFFDPGDRLMIQNEYSSELYIIANGEVEIRVFSDEGEKHISTIGNGDYLGEMAILDGAPRSASAYAKTKTRTLSINGSSFHAILRDRPTVALAVLSDLSKRIRELNILKIK